MDDVQRQPKDSDRESLVARITQAAAQGRISPADRDIRLGNVRSATSLAELDLIRRELDQLNVALPPTSAGAAPVEDRPWSTFEPGKHGGDAVEDDVSVIPPASVPPRVIGIGILLSAVVALALLLAGVFYVGYSAGHKDTPDGPDPRVQGDTTREPLPSGAPVPEADPVPAGTPYGLTTNGIRGFLQTYRKRFGTTRVVDLTLYTDYAIVGVPVPGRARQQSWLYRKKQWTTFGGSVRASFPGSQVVDTRQLDVPALVRNIHRARTRLNVEQAKPYVVVRFIRPPDDVPRVDVHVDNVFNESGYLHSSLDGSLRESHPYVPGQ